MAPSSDTWTHWDKVLEVCTGVRIVSGVYIHAVEEMTIAIKVAISDESESATRPLALFFGLGAIDVVRELTVSLPSDFLTRLALSVVPVVYWSLFYAFRFSSTDIAQHWRILIAAPPFIISFGVFLLYIYVLYRIRNSPKHLHYRPVVPGNYKDSPEHPPLVDTNSNDNTNDEISDGPLFETFQLQQRSTEGLSLPVLMLNAPEEAVLAPPDLPASSRQLVEQDSYFSQIYSLGDGDETSENGSVTTIDEQHHLAVSDHTVVE
jgi:hypothetical protein